MYTLLGEAVDDGAEVKPGSEFLRIITSISETHEGGFEIIAAEDEVDLISRRKLGEFELAELVMPALKHLLFTVHGFGGVARDGPVPLEQLGVSSVLLDKLTRALGGE